MSGGGKEIRVRRGDTLAGIAAREGVPLERIRDHDRNRALRERGPPDVLYPGDTVYVPAPELRSVQGSTGGVVSAKASTTGASLRLRLLRNGEPCEGARCTLGRDGAEPAETDGDGKVELALPAKVDPLALRVELRGPDGSPPARPRELTLRVGRLENETALLQARLTNLGFHCDPVDGRLEGRTRRALLRFQKAFGLDRTGEPDRATVDELRRLHEQDQTWKRRFTDEDKLCSTLDPPHHVLGGSAWTCINLLDGPEVIVDAHMHVNSGKCCPQPLAWDKNLLLRYWRPSRDTIENGVVPLVGNGAAVVQGLRRSSHAAAVELSEVIDRHVDATRADLVALNTVVAQTLVVAGYLGKEEARRNVDAAADGAARVLEGASRDLRGGAAALNATGGRLGETAQRLRAMVPDHAAPSEEVARTATTISGRIVESVARAYRRAEEVGAEGLRRVANGLTESAADATTVAAAAARKLAALDAELAAIAQAAAASMRPIAAETNRRLDLVEADARDLVQYVANEVRAQLDRGAAGIRRGADRAIDAADEKVQSALSGAEAKLSSLRDFTAISGLETGKIAAAAAAGNEATARGIPRRTRGDRLSMMVVMPMDMDFGHLEGYEGKEIYQKVETRQLLEIRLRPNVPGAPAVVLGRRPLPPGRTFTPLDVPGLAPAQPNIELRVVEERGPFYYYHQVRHDVPVRELVWLPAEEFWDFQPYPVQIEDTLAAAAAHPWTLLPLYHYDPRRWSEPAGAPPRTEVFEGRTRDVYPRAWDEPFQRWFRTGSLSFAGIKLYTALGYRPWDPRLQPSQEQFYDRCLSLDLPIVCHCSPGGMYSFDRPFFAEAEAKRRRVPVASLREETKDLMKARGVEPDDWAEYWFSEHYVSPRAWREVLRKKPALRLCLAHFGGDDPAFSRWAEKRGPGRDAWDEDLFRLTGEFENVYVDLSYFVFDAQKVVKFRKALEDHPHLREKILFGTDWWMVEMSGLDYKKFVQQSRQALDAIDPELWQRFSWLNPVRFYRLKENAKAIAEALRGARRGGKRGGGSQDATIERGLATLEALEPGAVRGR